MRALRLRGIQATVRRGGAAGGGAISERGGAQGSAEAPLLATVELHGSEAARVELRASESKIICKELETCELLREILSELLVQL